MIQNLKRRLLGEKLPTDKLSEEKFNVFWGLPLLASDAISSVAYAVDEILWVLVPAIGLTSYFWSPKIALAIIILLLVLTISYRQIVSAYPNGGGAYIVAKENLKIKYGLIVGASLSVDYILTVAVSISAGTAAVTSAIPALFPHRISIALFFIALMTIGNLRGVSESSKFFSIPTYAFLITILSLVIVGSIKSIGNGVMATPILSDSPVTFGTRAVSLFLLLRAFSSGCAAVTGVEAICDAVPNFKEPAVKNAKLAYVLLTIAVIITFGGITYLATVFHPVPNSQQTVIAQLAASIFGKGIMFYIIQGTTTVILAMAANTAFAGFPILLSIIARDGYVPRQFALRGHRLGFSNGILLLAIAAGTLIIVFQGDTHLLIPLYAIGVFTSFTLAQAGICLKWFRTKPKGWVYKAFINGLGTLITFITVIVIAITKFLSGAWVVLVIIPIIVLSMLKIRDHYSRIAKRLDIPNDRIERLKLSSKPTPYVIIPIQSLNVMVVKTLRYAKSLSNEVEVFNVETYEGEADKLRKKWAKLKTDVPLVIKQSAYRDIVGSLTEYIESNEHASRHGDFITVLLPQFVVAKPWEMALHNNTSLFIARALLNYRNIVVSLVPFQIEEKSELYKDIDLEIEEG
ncbi:APC family permease [Desulfosporosinus sp. Sb-LF]|uniref:APC family permease n=1 Tax=Desulfosporosinus sp. Sb-LF TaxID=2560027 RepID=UPI00107F2B3B|nr:APC family permease [Desulfosporosinus sp. Sb-LF]TGE32194.1 APC family permease [Desulfosporosinus sp. Sb-LF]